MNSARLAARIVLLAMCTGAGVARSPAAVLLNEVYSHIDPLASEPAGQHQWVELVNTGLTPVPLSGWRISGRDGGGGASARGLPAVILPANAYLTIHFASGTNDLDFNDGSGAYYTADLTGTLLFGVDMGECALYDGGAIADFVAWNGGQTAYVPGVAHNHAVAANIWTAGDYLISNRITHFDGDPSRSVTIGQSIGRDRDSTDTNTVADWDTNGGVNGTGLSPGARNYADLLFIEDLDNPGGGNRSGDGGVASNLAWTVMLYLDGDNNTENFAYAMINLIENLGGSTANVKFVCLVDGLGATRRGVLSSGQIHIENDPPGAPFRFEIVEDHNTGIVRVTPVGETLPLPEDATHGNMADGATLSAFITWAKGHFQADRYALVIFDHGNGWKAVCEDETSRVSDERRDFLFMKELRDTLELHFSNQKLDMLVFNACMMGMLEVAWQAQPYCKYMVASEQTMPVEYNNSSDLSRHGLITRLWVQMMRDNPQIDGRNSAIRMVDFYNQTWTDNSDRCASVIDANALPALIPLWTTLANGLRAGCDDFRKHDDQRDNVEEHIRIAARDATRFHDRNYVDLRHFALNVEADEGILPQYKPGIKEIVKLTKPWGDIVIYERHGEDYGDGEVNGLSIYFPLVRTTTSLNDNGKSDVKLKLKDPKLDDTDAGDAYDYPAFSRVSDAASQRACYAPNVDELPRLGRDVETGAALAAPSEWPMERSPELKFVDDTTWDEFLQRFYHPVSDNKIINGVCPQRGNVAPINRDYPGVDEIEVTPGCTVYFTGEGSSDADMGSTSRRTDPRNWMWDFDHLISSGGLAPYELAVNADAWTAMDDMNADQHYTKLPTDDEKDADSVKTSHVYNAIREYIVTLNVWDDNDKFSYHKTFPTAMYVHIQSDDHTSIVRVKQPPVPACPPPAQPGVPAHASNNVQGSTSDLANYVVADDFVPQVPGFVTTVCFFGAYSCTPNGNNFTVSYYAAQSSGLPGPLVAQYSQSLGSLSLVSQATGFKIAGVVDEYEFVVTHAPLPLTGGWCYWIEVTNQVPGCAWYWEEGYGGNGVSLQRGSQDPYAVASLITGDRSLNLDIPVIAGLPGTCLPLPPANDECGGAIPLVENVIYTVDNTYASANIGDPRPSCHASFQRRVAATVWYSFVASGTRARVQTCDTADGDSIISVYKGSCGGLGQIGCNDDACGLSSDVCVDDLTPGETYYVMLASFDDSTRGPYSIRLTAPCVIEPVACCFSNGTCAELLATVCAEQGGTDLGESSRCILRGNPRTYESADLPLAIPDANPAGVVSSIVVPPEDASPVHLVAVTVDIPEHTFVGDLRLRLSHNGVTVFLWNGACGGSDGLGVEFSDTGTAVSCGSPAVGVFRPTEPLSAFSGQSSDGLWTLQVADEAGADTGTLTYWSLTVSPPLGACPQPEACCFGDGACIVVAPSHCLAGGGSPKGAGSLCTFATCPAPAQACCLPTGGCIPATADGCTNSGGVLAGASCDLAPCAATCVRGDANCDGSVNNFDIDSFVTVILSASDPTAPPNFFAGQSCWDRRTCTCDLDHSTLVNNFDIDAFVACVIFAPAPGASCP